MALSVCGGSYSISGSQWWMWGVTVTLSDSLVTLRGFSVVVVAISCNSASECLHRELL